MRKGIGDGGETPKEGGGRRYWVRAHPPEPKQPADPTSARPAKARFLEPYRLSDDCRAALLEQLASSGLGDAESRALFATAVEYDIASFRQSSARPSQAATQTVVQAEIGAPACAEPQPTGSAKPRDASKLRSALVALSDTDATSIPAALTAVAGQIRALAGAIDALDEPNRAALAAALTIVDPFRRGYDGGYLDAICQELRRIDRALTPSADAAAPEAPTAKSPLPAASPPQTIWSEPEKRFVRRIAGAFEQCLETKPTAAPDGPFFAALRILAPDAGLPLPAEPDRLAPVLAHR